MKPYGKTVKNYGNTGCCPGHDSPRIRIWSGRYKSRRSHTTDSKYTKIQNRIRRRIEKYIIKKESKYLEE